MGITRWPNKLRRFGALSLADKWLLLRAAWWLAVARIWLVRVPFPELSARLGAIAGNEAADPELPRRVGFAVRAAAGSVPWRSDCFPQVIAGWMLLKHYGYNSSIHLGVERVGDDDLAGHAWLTCRGKVVMGGEELARYTEMLLL